jgi:hypothetical protein
MADLRKKMIAGVSLLIAQGVCGMEQQIQPVQPGSLSQYVSPETLGIFSNVAATGWGMVATGFTKATTTAINALSDDAAFAKLGYPPTSTVNASELDKFKGISERHMGAILANGTMAEEFRLDEQFLNRRIEFLKRAIHAVPGRVDGVELAAFCLEHYQGIMNSFMVARMATFIKSKEEVSRQVSQKLNSLGDSSDSSLLRSVLQGSGVEQDEQKEEKNDDQQ